MWFVALQYTTCKFPLVSTMPDTPVVPTYGDEGNVPPSVANVMGDRNVFVEVSKG